MADDIFGNPGTQEPASQVPAQVTPVASAQPDPKPAESAPQNIDPYTNLLSGIQSGDGRQKYATVSDALTSIPHAQTHIKDLSDKVKELEGKLEQASSIDDVLKRVQSKQAVDETPSKQELDETKLAQVMENMLTQREHKTSQETNQQTVVKSLADKFGDKAKEAYVAKAEELGLPIDVFNDLARTSPTAILKYFDATPSKSASSFSKPSVNSAAMDMKSDQPNDDYMSIYRSQDSALVNKWRQAVSNITEG